MTKSGRLFDLQRASNATSRDGWERFSSHRRHITGLCLQAAANVAQQDLCVLGSGNCNDIDLAELLQQFGRISLLDLDPRASGQGVARQLQSIENCKELRERIDVQTGTDVSGVYSLLESSDQQTIDVEAIVDAADDIDQVFGGLPDSIRNRTVSPDSGFDVVLSVGLLSQIIHSVLEICPIDTPAVVKLIQSVRTSHAQLMLRLLRPGGRGILTAEIVSTDTAPGLKACSDFRLPSVLQRLLSERNYFTGLHPDSIRSLFTPGGPCHQQIASLDIQLPWLWDFGPRIYAVTAFVFVKS